MRIHERNSETRDRFLELLSDGFFHSGESIAKELEITRAAIWKHTKALQKMGLDIFCVRGKGYRLAYPLELLDKERIQSRVAAQDTVMTVNTLIKTVSTNTRSKRFLNSKEPPELPLAIAAEWQSEGRGRMGRPWVSPFGRSLSFSYSAELDLPSSQLSGLSLLIGLAVAKTLKKYGAEDVGLKWPNDLICRNGEFKGSKLGGILVEIAGETEGPSLVTIGVGLNLNVPEKEMEEVDQPWVNIIDLLPGDHINLPFSRNELLGDMLVQISQHIDNFVESGFSEYLEEWKEFDDLYGEKVYIIHPRQRYHGVANGISKNGGLCLLTQNGTLEINSGEVKVRRENA